MLILENMPGCVAAIMSVNASPEQEKPVPPDFPAFV
jgi:hypothetical protein